MHRPLLQDLPQFLRDDPATKDLLQAFERLLLGGDDDISTVLNASANQLGLENLLDDLPRYFSPGTTPADGAPDEFLLWLSQWVALSLRTDITYGEKKDLAQENELRRNFISELVHIYRYRGTKLSMESLVKIFTAKREALPDGTRKVTEREVGIDDQIDGQSHFFVIRPNLEDIKGGGSIAEYDHVMALAHSIIQLEKPSHTRYQLVPKFWSMRIGQRAEPPDPPPGYKLPTVDYIRVGINTRIGDVPDNPNPVWGKTP